MRKAGICIGLLFFTLSCVCQTVISPDQFLSFQYGKAFTSYYLKVQYFKEVAASSPRVRLNNYGTTYEGRPLLQAIVSSSGNIDDLDSIRINNVRRTGLMPGTFRKDSVAIVWFSFGVHGNEASASETALALLYELVRDGNPYEEWLENVIVIIDLCLNPDGHARYVNWFKQVGVIPPNPFPDGWEHRENWPGGRGNHYLFDLNRDWTWLQQTETKARLKQYHRWMPHIHVDVHEMEYNSSYYFAPAAKPFHNYIPAWQPTFQELVGRNHAKYFDENNWNYFTGETFDLFYPGYGDTYPIFNGAIGMTYEQGGGGKAGVAVLRDNGDTITLHERILYHFTTCLSTIEAASQNADLLISEFTTFWNLNSDPPGQYKTFIIKNSNRTGNIKQLCELLDQHFIEYGTLRTSLSIQAFDYQEGTTGQIDVGAGDLIIYAGQPKSLLTQVLFDPVARLEDSLTYDITSWSLPYAFGLETYASTQEIIPEAIFELPIQQDVKLDIALAYIFEWGSTVEVKLLADLLTMGLKPRVALSPFKLNGKNYDRGTVVLLRADNLTTGKNFDRIIRDLASTRQIAITGVESSWTEEGPDLGSNQFKLVCKPKILLIGGEGTSATSFGQAWHYFEQIIGYPATLIKTNQIDKINLQDFTTIIMPSGNYSDMEIKSEELKEWVNQGGTLIAIAHASSWLEKTRIFGIVAGTENQNEVESEEHKMIASTRIFADRYREKLSNASSGAFIQCSVDNTHPLGFGLPPDLFVLKTNELIYSPIEEGWNVGFFPEDLMISGFVGTRLKKKISNTISFAVQDIGNGRVVYFIDDPLYRGFLVYGQVLFANAIFITGVAQ
jgi:hypothetical protein